MPNLSNTPESSVALTPEMSAMVNRAVASGEYASSGELIDEALQEWRLRRTLSADAQMELQSLWAEGLASGPGQFAGIADIKREARRRLAAGTKPATR